MPDLSVRFRIYYGMWDGEAEEYRYWTFDGSCFSDAIQAPTSGVQLILQENPEKPRGYDIVGEKDYYVWRPDYGWCGMNESGYACYQRETGFPKYVIFGYALRNDAFRNCHKRALQEGLG